MSEQAEREAFESFADDIGAGTLPMNRTLAGEYADAQVNGMWEAWKARSKLPRVPDRRIAVRNALADLVDPDSWSDTPEGFTWKLGKKHFIDTVGGCYDLLEDEAPVEPDSPWISCAEKRPPLTRLSLGWNATANTKDKANTYRLVLPVVENTSDVSHWMPLPEPPALVDER